MVVAELERLLEDVALAVYTVGRGESVASREDDALRRTDHLEISPVDLSTFGIRYVHSPISRLVKCDAWTLLDVAD